jgi:serine/threonine protein phosphatase PrpC
MGWAKRHRPSRARSRPRQEDQVKASDELSSLSADAPPGTDTCRLDGWTVEEKVLRAEDKLSPLPEPRLAALAIGRDPVRQVEAKLYGSASPYRPDTVVDGGTAFGLTLRAASVRGRTKRFEGEAREDDFCLLTSRSHGVVVVAVADGLGTAARSSLGSALAVRHAVAAVEEQLNVGTGPLDWPTVFNRAASALVVEHRRQSSDEASRQRPDYDETRAVSKDLGTTLTVVVLRPDSSGVASISAAAIGDSPVLRLANGKYELLVGSRATDEAFSTSAVVALPYLPAPETVERTFEQHEVLLICTDGFSEPLSEGNSDVGRFFARELVVPPPLASWGYLVDFEKATYDDDRTLVAIWPEQSNEETKELRRVDSEVAVTATVARARAPRPPVRGRIDPTTKETPDG